MPTAISPLPDLSTLIAGLKEALQEAGLGNGQLMVLDRQPNRYGAEDARSEIVTCRLADPHDLSFRDPLRFFCKYEAADVQPWSHVAYEAEVYRQVLQPLPVSTPTFYGAPRPEGTGRTCLVLQYLDKARPLGEVWDPEAMPLAARWLGGFHAAVDRHLAGRLPRFLKVYDVDYYLQRARRIVQAASNLPEDLAWLPVLGQRLESFVRPLLLKGATICHGDFYAHNVLREAEAIYPIDWEHCGIDVGEMDLACLTEGWRGEVERQCQLEYQRARWPGGPPSHFEPTLGAARLCLYFDQWAGRPNWTDRQSLWYGTKLHELGVSLGLI